MAVIAKQSRQFFYTCIRVFSKGLIWFDRSTTESKRLES